MSGGGLRVLNLADGLAVLDGGELVGGVELDGELQLRGRELRQADLLGARGGVGRGAERLALLEVDARRFELGAAAADRGSACSAGSTRSAFSYCVTAVSQSFDASALRLLVRVVAGAGEAAAAEETELRCRVWSIHSFVSRVLTSLVAEPSLVISGLGLRPR